MVYTPVTNAAYVLKNELNKPFFPANLNTIEEEAFENTSFQAVIIPGSVTTIGKRAFANCRNPVYVYIPAGVSSLAGDAFAGCPNAAIDQK